MFGHLKLVKKIDTQGFQVGSMPNAKADHKDPNVFFDAMHHQTRNLSNSIVTFLLVRTIYFCGKLVGLPAPPAVTPWGARNFSSALDIHTVRQVHLNPTMA